jgi:uncharacterized protein (TIGR02145 family)
MYSKTAGNGFSGNYFDLTNKPILFSGSYNDLTNKPTLFNGSWTNITGKPTSLAGYGITDGMNTYHVANGINSTMIGNWNTAFSWGNHAGLYRPISYVPAWSEITGKPTTLSGYGITDAVNTTGNQTIAGNKTFTGSISVSSQYITNVANPVNDQDAATKSYVDVLGAKITMLENTLKAGGIVTDVDGNSYNTVVGTQTWMAENLKVARYKNGTTIPLVTDNKAWAGLGTPGYCWYNNDEATNEATYGALYNWFTVNTGNLCPADWHVPTDAEWTTLITYLGGGSVAGGKLKETGTTHWFSPNYGATNETGFTALPGGNRSIYGACGSIGNIGYWWSSSGTPSASWYWSMSYGGTSIHRDSDGYGNVLNGFSVRCLRD